MSASDETDWARACAGESSSFTRVYDQHLRSIQGAALRWTTAADDADDLVALTFLIAWERRRQVRFVDGSIRPWLLVVATNVGRNLSKARRRHREFLRDLPPPQLVMDTAADGQDGPATDALTSLSRADREVVTLCLLEDYSMREAAAALGVAEGTVKSRLHRARRRLSHLITIDDQPEGILNAD